MLVRWLPEKRAFIPGYRAGRGVPVPSPPTMAIMHMSQSTTARIRAAILAFGVSCIPPTAGLPGTKQLIVSPIVPKTKGRFRFAIVDAQDPIVGSAERPFLSWASFEEVTLHSVRFSNTKPDRCWLLRPRWASSSLKR